MGTMFDTTDPHPASALSGLDVEAVAAYADGLYANAGAVRQEFPRAHLLEVDVSGAGVGDAGDFERGDMVYADAGGWAKRRIAAGVHRPVVYFQVSAWDEVMQSLRAAGLTRADVRVWTAHYTGRPHLCSSACEPGIDGHADATQWGSPQAPGTLRDQFAGRNIDVSLLDDDFWAAH
jgi:hypothetical protein